MQKIEINKNISIFQIKDRDLFTTLLPLEGVFMMQGGSGTQDRTFFGKVNLPKTMLTQHRVGTLHPPI